MPNEITIPMLPCHSINEMLAFYRVLGFEVTYQQSKPNNYAVVCRGGIELHFFTMPAYQPADSYSTCYVRADAVAELYAAFVAALRQHYGRVSSAGIPRVIPLKNKSGRREFIIVDPRGNWIRVGQPDQVSANDDPANTKAEPTKLARALQAATLLSDGGHDDRASAMLDKALSQTEGSSTVDRVAALVYRAGLAITLGDQPLAHQLLNEIGQTPLQDDERITLAAELARAEELAQLG